MCQRRQNNLRNALLAQGIEHGVSTAGVGGSIPSEGAMKEWIITYRDKRDISIVVYYTYFTDTLLIEDALKEFRGHFPSEEIISVVRVG